MEDSALKDMWNEYGSKIEESRVLNMQSWALNLHCLEMIQSQKAKSKLRILTVSKFIGIITGIIWIAFLGMLVYLNQFKNPFFSASISILFMFNLVAVINYIRHLVMIGRVNYSESITGTQQRLASLKTALINNNRFLLLQFPFYTTWSISWQWITGDPLSFWLIEFPIVILLTVLGIWLYINYSPKNLHKPWVRGLMNSTGLRSVTKALDFLNEIEEYKKDKDLSS